MNDAWDFTHIIKDCNLCIIAASRDFVHSGFCPIRDFVLRDFVYSGFCRFEILSIGDFVRFGILCFGILFFGSRSENDHVLRIVYAHNCVKQSPKYRGTNPKLDKSLSRQN